MGKRKYSCSVEFADDYVDERAIELVNKALEDSGSEYRFINLPVVDQCGYFVFVPPSVYESAIQIGLVPSQKKVDSLLGIDDDFE